MDDHVKQWRSYSQPGPSLGNQFLGDSALVGYLGVMLPPSVGDAVHADLVAFGDKVAGEYLDMARMAEDEPPRLVKHDAFGKQVDELRTSEGWRFFKPQAAKEGLVAIAYENDFAQYSRLYQVVKLYLFGPSSGLFSCPLAMTDGAAFTLRQLTRRKDFESSPEIEEAFQHLTSRDPDYFWTSGQWMTEKQGGSDVSNGTTTLALPDASQSGVHNLYGYKWFSSATDSDMTLTLARSVKDGKPIPGNKGLSLFFARVKDNSGNLNNLELIRLKEKLGTRQLPTGEILLNGMKAKQLGKEGDGVRFISNMLNITRLHNAISAVSNMRRIIALARDYSDKRVAFGKKIKDHLLHFRILSWAELTFRGNLAFLLNVTLMLGRIDHGSESPEDRVLFRLLTPLLKLFTAKDAIKVTSEGLEMFGGIGYMENSYLPGILRDSQVLPIWEGTTNILSLDLLRAIMKWPRSLDIFYDHLKRDLSTQDTKSMTDKTRLAAVETLTSKLDSWYASTIQIVRHKDYMEFFCRTLTFNMSLLYICHKLMIIYTVTKTDKDFETFLHWISRLEREYEAPKEPRMLECFVAREKMMGLDLPNGEPQPQSHPEMKAKI